MLTENLINSKSVDEYIMLFNMLNVPYFLMEDSITLYDKDAIKVLDIISKIEPPHIIIKHYKIRYKFLVNTTILKFNINNGMIESIMYHSKEN